MLLSGIAIYKNQRSPAAVNRLLETHFPALFHTASALSAPAGHLPLEGKADDTREPAIKRPSGISIIYTLRRFIFLCAAPPLLTPHSSLLTPHSKAELSSAIKGHPPFHPQTAAKAAVFLDFLLK